MKQFFKFMFASMLGFFLTFVLIMILFIGIMASAISFAGEDSVTIPEKTILVLNFDEPVNDRSPSNPFTGFDFANFKTNKNIGLNEVLHLLKKAADDSKISGILLDLDQLQAGSATTEEIRNGLIDFKKSGKFIYSYSEGYSQKAYYLASVSDKIFLNPTGSLDFKGLAGQVMFLKGLLNKLEIEPQIIRHGKFKSAVEPLILDKMSAANRGQTLSFISSMWNQMLKGISESRKISVKQLTAIADSLKIGDPKDALALKLVDKLAYKDEVIDELMTKTGAKENKDLSLITLGKYSNSPDNESSGSRDKIAVIYALGSIGGGEGDDQTIGSEKISKTIRKARLDKNVKAIVLRVNSPGGSALASDVIWREMVLAKQAKPVVVSMGDVAASGGYYIACAASKIIASPNTITGSIGVFGIVPNMQKFFNNKLGITFDEVKTNAYADYISGTRPMTEMERKFLTRDIEKIYSTFIGHVAQGRGMTVAQIDSIGQGRVWSGADAKRIGLIDDFGGLNFAIETAAKLAKLEKYRVTELPEQKDPFTMIMEEIGKDNSSRILKSELGENYAYLNYIREIAQMKGVQARLPFQISIE
ncbi:MAG: signal peptide peptidase SppA [Bacteroidales bacterium]